MPVNMQIREVKQVDLRPMLRKLREMKEMTKEMPKTTKAVKITGQRSVKKTMNNRELKRRRRGGSYR